MKSVNNIPYQTDANTAKFLGRTEKNHLTVMHLQIHDAFAKQVRSENNQGEWLTFY